MEQQYIDKLCELIEISSVYSEEAVPGGPFGKNVKKALENILDFGSKLGFSVKNYDGYAGEMTMGCGEYMIGVLCHIDVVAAGSGWTKEPFTATIENGRIYGRGSSDDKGPLVAILSAISKLSLEGKIPEDISIRVIIGTNEEESWQGINYYLKKADRLPEVSIVPDGMFPVIYCEKGLLDLDLKAELHPDAEAEVRLISLSGGEGRNIVAPEASAVLRCKTERQNAIGKALLEVCKQKNIKAEVKIEDDKIIFRVTGKPAHAMTPEKGVNAISQMISALDDAIGDSLSHRDFVAGYMKVIGTGAHGEEGGFAFADEESGLLTFNIGMVEFEEQSIVLKANVRYPTSMKKEFVMSAINKGLKRGGFAVEEVDYLPPVSFRTDSPLIEILMEAYREVTGDTVSKPISMGGATYARAIPNAVSYGALFPDEEELAHEADEYISLTSLKKSEQIYYIALEKLILRRICNEE